MFFSCLFAFKRLTFCGKTMEVYLRPMFQQRAAPPIYPVGNLILPEPRIIALENGIQLYVLDYPGQEVLKIEVVFQAGRPEEQKRLASRTTARLIREGTLRHSGAEIAEHFDFYGSSISVPTNLDTSNFTLFTLVKYAEAVIPTFAELLLEPSFPETELETYRRTGIQELSVELEKVETVAYRKVTELIFGENHPYGYNSTDVDYRAIQRDDLLHFYQQWYRPENCMIFASGRVDQRTIDLLNQHLGKLASNQPKQPAIIPQAANHQVLTTKNQKLHISHPGSLQTAIKIGRRAFGRKHPDYNGLFILNTVLGGYFGSRLMANIREKKGFTYNIYSTLDAYQNDGCLYIATEVNTENTAAAMKAILLEMKKLREKPVEEQELAMVQNYLLGMLLNGLDGPMNVSDIIRGMVVEGLAWDTFSQLVETIRTITPEQLQELARKYLQPEDFWMVTVG